MRILGQEPTMDTFDPICLQVQEEGFIQVPHSQFLETESEWLGVTAVEQIVKLTYDNVDCDLAVVIFKEAV